jgi:hydrogenase small subunit
MRHKRPSRRAFLKLGATLAAGLGLPSNLIGVFAEELDRLAQGLPRVLWLQGQACGGCSVSLLNADKPTILEAITQRIRLAFHPTLSAAQGNLAMEVIEEVERSPEPFILVLEGAVPAKMPEACRIGGRPFTEMVLPALRKAKYLVAAGTCASFGGIPSAEGSCTGAASVQEFLEAQRIPVQNRLVNCPGCPCHPEELLGALAHLAAKGYPEVRSTFTPTMYSTGCLHYECPRMPQFNARIFATRFGDGDGCLYQLGCRGVDVYADCQRRRWNGGTNWCIDASAPCLGCNQPLFGKSRMVPFYPSGS